MLIGSSDILLHQVQPIPRPIYRIGLVTFTAYNECNGAQSRGILSTAIENCAVLNLPASIFAKLLRSPEGGYSDRISQWTVLAHCAFACRLRRLPVACLVINLPTSSHNRDYGAEHLSVTSIDS